MTSVSTVFPGLVEADRRSRRSVAPRSATLLVRGPQTSTFTFAVGLTVRSSVLARQLQRSPSVAEIAASVGVTEEQVLEAMDASGAYRAASIDAPRGDEEEAGDTVGDTVGSDEHGYNLAEDRATLDRLLRAISPREREVLRLRFQEDLTQAEIGERIGVSQMQVSRLIRQALGRLRSMARLE